MVTTPHYHTLSRTRRAGVLLHPTSLPGPLDNGDIGHQAYRFIEFLRANGFKVWQMLPIGPTHEDRSPYQCLSSHAGNPLLISLEWLVDRGWLELEPREDVGSDEYRMRCLKQAGHRFLQTADEVWHERAQKFYRENAHWLNDFSLFVALKKKYHDKSWCEWPAELRQRDPAALELARQELQQGIQQTEFEQFVFFTQWNEIHEYARSNQIELYGDLPLFVSLDSADVWAQRENFLINGEGGMEYVAGVPPDAFSDTGQRWGNPLFDWDSMKLDGFHWWKQRVNTQLKLFDLVRIDHFRGLQACWYIPTTEKTAINGKWVEVPGGELLEELHQYFHRLPLVAEDLGLITEEVVALKEEFNLPGMKVLQFAFDGNTGNPHLPHNQQSGDTVYTGTHDNDTTLGWANNLHSYNKDYLNDYSGISAGAPSEIVWSLIRLAMSSVSFLVMLPMQDILMLDSDARMNIPGTTENNWRWRFEWQQLEPDAVKKISHLITIYQR